MSTQPSKLLIAFLTFSAYGNATGCQFPGQKCDNYNFQCCNQQCVWSQPGPYGRCQSTPPPCTPDWQSCQWNSDCCSNTCLWPSEGAGSGVCRTLSSYQAMNGGASSTAIGTQGGKTFTYAVHQRRLGGDCQSQCAEQGDSQQLPCMQACEQGITEAMAHLQFGVGGGVRRLDSSDELNAPEDSQNADESCEEPDVCFVYQADCCLGSVCVAPGYYADGYCTTPTLALVKKAEGFVTSADQENGDDRRL